MRHKLKARRIRAGMRGDVMHWRNRLVVSGKAQSFHLRGHVSWFARLWCYAIGVS